MIVINCESGKTVLMADAEETALLRFAVSDALLHCRDRHKGSRLTKMLGSMLGKLDSREIPPHE